MLIYLHGLNSSSASFKAEELRKHLAPVEVRAPSYPAHRPDEAVARLSEFLSGTDRDNPPILVGSSTGGFYGQYLARQFPLKHLLPMIRMTLCILLASLLSACGEPGNDSAKVPDMPRFSDARLSQGRSVWMGTCRNCHLLGVSNAPAVTDHKAWLPRIAKGKQALYESALNGVKGVQNEVRMPPRGGNPRLSDEQVKKAVDYMIASVEHLKNAAP